MVVNNWTRVRAAWDTWMPRIATGERCDPYFYHWKFTPIEEEAWNGIRRFGLRLYPQVPVGGVFIDFGDPYLKIGLELDGEKFHDEDRDRSRDMRLWEQYQWRIFRIKGCEIFRYEHPPTEPGFANDAARGSDEYNRELHRFAHATGDGVLWAMYAIFYNSRHPNDEEREIALESLDIHRLIDFSLPSDEFI